MSAEELCDRLRALVQDCIAKHLYTSAVFYADKLVTLSQHGPGDVFLLAQVRCATFSRPQAAFCMGMHAAPPIHTLFSYKPLPAVPPRTDILHQPAVPASHHAAAQPWAHERYALQVGGACPRDVCPQSMHCP